MEHYRYLFEKVLGRSLNIYGLNILKTDYRISVRLVAYAVVASFYCIGNVATCFLNTYIEALKAMSTESAWLMCAYKPYIVFVNRDILRVKFDYLRGVYKGCERSRSARLICDTWGGRFRLLAKIYFIAIASAVISYILMPLPLYLATHAVDPVLTTPLPGIDIDTKSGYWTANFIHTCSLLMAAVTMISSDLTIVILTLHVCLMSDVFVSKLNELEEHLDNTDKNHERNYGRVTRGHLCEVVRLHQEICAYETDIAKMFYLMFLIDVLLDWSAMCLCLFAAMVMTWGPLYAEFIGMFLRLMYSCATGTLVEIYTDRILEGLLNFKYYWLHPREQRMYALMLYRTQNQSVLVAGTMPMNMQLFVGVMKNTYSFAMFLWNMF